LKLDKHSSTRFSPNNALSNKLPKNSALNFPLPKLSSKYSREKEELERKSKDQKRRT